MLVLILQICKEGVDLNPDLLLVLRLYTRQRVGFTWNGIVQVSATDLGEQHAIFLAGEGLQEAGKDLVCVSQPLVNVASRMPATETLHLSAEPEITLWRLFFLVFEICAGTLAPGTTDVDFPLLFGVEVDQDVT